MNDVSASVKLLYFAEAARLAGIREEFWEIGQPITSEELWDSILQRHPRLTALRPITRVARNRMFLKKGELIYPQDEVALIPPVSGG